MSHYLSGTDLLGVYYVTYGMGGIGLVLVIIAVVLHVKATRQRAAIERSRRLVQSYDLLTYGIPFMVIGIAGAIILLSDTPSYALDAVIAAIGLIAIVAAVWLLRKQRHAAERYGEDYIIEDEAQRLYEEG